MLKYGYLIMKSNRVRFADMNICLGSDPNFSCIVLDPDTFSFSIKMERVIWTLDGVAHPHFPITPYSLIGENSMILGIYSLG